MESTLFMNAAADAKRLWVEFSDIEPLKVIEWKRAVREARLDINSKRLYGKKAGNGFRELQNGYRSLVDIAEPRCSEILQRTAKPAMFMVTAAEGTVISMSGQADLLRRMEEEHNLGLGTVFNLQKSGVNAITVARELKRWVFLKGSEHELQLFARWSCFCSPIHQDERIVGYLDLSFADEEDHVLFASIFDFTLRGIEEGLRQQSPDARKESVMERLREYKLTPRELEIGYLWLMNNSVRSIAEKLVLTEGTTRLVIKKVYKKTVVSDKGGFLSKFL
ncbi:hypothetical protein RB620_22925 [Paenibacillus sp. LHD-117]|uniref:hypothetical protein n=1 Tax=Paenibacillus sp. LHD-117 TaxID=3071412 RepID=UPI0027E005C4|nr:hypothetical protein [Paenibacillus sp. LHD-117]MDQ6422286.1 hypothetical protein [Paenibacillus sp. LHD-117]